MEEKYIVTTKHPILVSGTIIYKYSKVIYIDTIGKDNFREYIYIEESMFNSWLKNKYVTLFTEPQIEYSVEIIIKLVLNYFNKLGEDITEAKLKRNVRYRETARIRQYISYYSMKLTKVSPRIIGSYLRVPDLDRGAVIHGRRVITELYEVNDKEITNHVNNLNKIFNL